jgi:hypothetical protein
MSPTKSDQVRLKNMTHNGKIGKLPIAVREELNRRLDNGGQGRQLLEWLNSLPEVQAVVATEFDGKPIRKQNLSEWRNGGYAHWLQQQEVLDMARQLSADTGELQPIGAQPLTDQMAVWLTARYLLAIRKLAGKNPDGEPDLKVLREFCHDVVALRRGDHSAARLKIEHERLEREREETEAEAVEHFKRWANNPTVREAICGECLSPEERERRLREIFGRPPEPPEPPVANDPTALGSNPVKPGQTESDPIQPNPTHLADGHTPVASRRDDHI